MMEISKPIDLNISMESEDQDNSSDKSLPFHRVLRILKQVKVHLDLTLASTELIRDLSWAIKRIETNSLYTLNVDETIEEEDDEDIQQKEFVENFSGVSQIRDTIRRKNRERLTFHTSHHSLGGLRKMRDKLQNVKFKSLNTVKEEEENKNQHIQIPDRRHLSMKNTNEFRNLDEKDKLISDNGIAVQQVVETLSMKKKYPTFDDKSIINYRFNVGGKFDKSVDDSDGNFNMNSVVSKSFNIFHFESVFGREKSFILLGKEILRSLDVMPLIDSTKLDNFLTDLRNYYIPYNYYHNDRHGADVGQTIGLYIKESDMIEMCFFSDLDILACLISAIAHDVGHPGFNNNFQINSKNELAMTYHDKSVLENYHIYLLFKILKKDESNILVNMQKEDYGLFRKRCIEAILATDMAFHGKVLSSVKNRLFTFNENKKNDEMAMLLDPSSKTLFDDQQEVINLVIHACDISHNTKPFKISEKWTEFLTEEFHAQGDNEKNLQIPISFLCDRNEANVPKSQIGFINFIIIPTFELIVQLAPSLDFLMVNVKENLSEWEKRLEENEKQKK